MTAKRIAVGAHVSSSGGIYTAIERAEAIEAEAIQIFPSPPQMWRATRHTPEAIAQFRAAHAASSIGEVWLHNIYLANLASDDPELLAKSIDSVVNALTVADAIGAEGVILHTGSHKGRGLDDVEDQICDAIATIFERAPGSAMLALENAAGHGGVIGKTFAELGALLHGVRSPRLQVCIDTCHAFAAGYNIAEPEGMAIAMTEFDSEIGLERLKVVHANDSKMPLGGERDRHENIGDGHIGFEGFRTILGAEAFQGLAFLLEVPGIPDADGKANGPDLENIRRLKAIRDGGVPDVSPAPRPTAKTTVVAKAAKPARLAKVAKPARPAKAAKPARPAKATNQPVKKPSPPAKTAARTSVKQPAKAKRPAKATKAAPSAAGRPSRGTRPPSGGSRRAGRS